MDERCDVYQSTKAACLVPEGALPHFRQLGLALAAYNVARYVNKAIRRSGGGLDYGRVYDHLPRETRGTSLHRRELHLRTRRGPTSPGDTQLLLVRGGYDPRLLPCNWKHSQGSPGGKRPREG
ncbi:MAG: hypothetical protein IPP33_09720 [Flavobacteriales bacterium]|nr:hypothetical protein [Flavobacteriales bacterium]